MNEHYVKYWRNSVGPGWHSIVEPLVNYCVAHDIQITQIKEKFATLRFYTVAANEEFYALLREAENKSAITCEQCGAPGIQRGTSWVYTACDEHVRKYSND